MEHYLITIDSGTTNTRVALWNQKKACVDIYKSEIGVRVTAVEGNNKGWPEPYVKASRHY